MKWKEQGQALTKNIRTQALVLGGCLLLAWILETVDVIFFKERLDGLGIRPRQIMGLRGILLCPFLHHGFRHIAANTVPFLVLGWFVMLRRNRDLFSVSGIILLVSGFLVWLLGSSDSVHVGASGLIFGYQGYLLLRGYFERSLLAVSLAVLAGILYGGLLAGVLPGQTGISWMGHLFGFAAGGLAGYVLANKDQRPHSPA